MAGPANPCIIEQAGSCGQPGLRQLERAGEVMKILAGNSNRALTEAIAAYLGVPLTKCQVRRFADMEIFVEIQENVRGQDTFVVQSTSYPAHDHLMEVLF